MLDWKKWLVMKYLIFIFWNKMELYSRGWIRYSQSLPYLLLFKPLPRAQNLIILSSTRSATAIFTKFEKKSANSDHSTKVGVYCFMKGFYQTKARSLSCRSLSNVQSTHSVTHSCFWDMTGGTLHWQMRVVTGYAMLPVYHVQGDFGDFQWSLVLFNNLKLKFGKEFEDGNWSRFWRLSLVRL